MWSLYVSPTHFIARQVQCAASAPLAGSADYFGFLCGTFTTTLRLVLVPKVLRHAAVIVYSRSLR